MLRPVPINKDISSHQRQSNVGDNCPIYNLNFTVRRHDKTSDIGWTEQNCTRKNIPPKIIDKRKSGVTHVRVHSL